MTGQTHDWEFLYVTEASLGAHATGDLFGQPGKASSSAAFAIGTEAHLYRSYPKLQQFQHRLHEGLTGPLEFAGMYAGIAAKYAYFCSLGKPKIVLQHFAAQSWEPFLSDFSIPEPISSECWSEALGVAEKAWAIMQEEPKLLTYGAGG